jgi:AbrB family looped-hinge helix DNA binding protein
MRVTSKGQVTIPQEVRNRLGIKPGTEVEFKLDGNGARLERARSRRGAKLVRGMRGRAKVTMSTDEIMALTPREDG